MQHLSGKKADPAKPNLRQVHLINAEMLDGLVKAGYTVQAGDLGENITVRGADLFSLPSGTVLKLGPDAVIRLTGLRDPCYQIDRFMKGVRALVTTNDEHGKHTGRCGVMAVVTEGGEVKAGDRIQIILPPEPHLALQMV